MENNKLFEEFENRFYDCWNATQAPNAENVKSFMWDFIYENTQPTNQVQQNVRHLPFEQWMKEVVKIEPNCGFMLDGYQTGEIFEWHEWWYRGLTPNEAAMENHRLYA